MTTGLEELIAGISRSPRSASITTPKAINKITKNNLATPPSSSTQSQEEEEEEDKGSDSEMEQEHKHDNEEEEETKEFPTSKFKHSTATTTTPPAKSRNVSIPPPAPRKAKRHIRQDKERADTEFSPELLQKQFPRSRICKVLRRAGVVSCVWSIPDENQLGIEDIIRLGVLARNASMLTKCAETASAKQYNGNGDPIVKVDKDDPSIIDDATKHNYKIRLQDVITACALKDGKVYSDETFPSTKTSTSASTTTKNKSSSVSVKENGHTHADDGDDEKENISPRAAKKQKV